MSDASKVTVIFWATSFPIFLSTIGAVKDMKRKLIEIARIIGMTGATIFGRVILLAAEAPPCQPVRSL